jgi:glucokinase
MFCAFLGSVAGNAALTFGARGGVLIAGGIAPRIVEYLRGSAFRERFEAKGRLRSYLAGIATKIVTRSDPTFVGLTALASVFKGGAST